MGGSGSGRYFYGTIGDNGKDITDRQRFLDVNYLHRQGYLSPVSVWRVAWRRNGQPTGNIVGRTETSERIVLVYRYRLVGEEEWQDIVEAVTLVYTPCTYGGQRPWFLCPGVKRGVPCQRRVGKLFAAGRLFLCRHCHDLAYRSQREGVADRLLTKAQNIRQRLGGSGSMAEEFPDRPKGMHRKTYARLSLEGKRYEQMSLLSRIGGWLDVGQDNDPFPHSLEERA